EELLEGVDPGHARLAQHGAGHHVRRGERGRVRRGGPCAVGAAAGLHRHDRLGPGDATGHLGEPPRVPEGLQIKQDHVGRLVEFPVLEQVVARDVGLVPGGHERGDPEPAGLALGEQGDPERTRLRHEPDPAGARRGRREGRVEPYRGVGVDHAHGVGADDAHAVAPGQLHHGAFGLASLPAG
ncbi:Uncharacterized protein APZ42_001456, partial [Daphnia magna]